MNGSASSASDASHVKGSVLKNTNSTSAFTFPTGDGTYYRGIGITPQGNGATTYTAEYKNTGYGDYTLTGSNIVDVTQKEYWTLGRGGASPENAKINLSWNANSAMTGPTIADIIVAHYNGSDWQTIGGTFSQTGDLTSGTTTSDVYWSTYSPFTLGKKTTPLPIELTIFTAASYNGFIQCKWSTATETNNDYFTLDRSYDAELWEYVAHIKGAGNTNEIKYYEYNDKQDHSGLLYYRLSQIDFDGKITRFDPVSVKCNDNELTGSFIIFPNPAGNKIKILFSNFIQEDGNIIIYDQLGKSVATIPLKGINDQKLIEYNIANLASGSYYVKCLFDKKTLPVQWFVKSGKE